MKLFFFYYYSRAGKREREKGNKKRWEKGAVNKKGGKSHVPPMP